MLCADAAVAAGRPLVNERLDSGEESRVFGRRGDVQVEVSVTWKLKNKKWVAEKHRYSASCLSVSWSYPHVRIPPHSWPGPPGAPSCR